MEEGLGEGVISPIPAIIQRDLRQGEEVLMIKDLY